MTREATWTNQGVELSDCKTVDELLASAGLNYEVVKRPVQYRVGSTWYKDENHFVTADKDNPNHTFGIVGNNYNVCQNIDAFDFINDIEGDIQFLKAGETSNGLVYIISQLPAINVLGDTIRPNIIFQNGHNGVYSIKANICMLRIVCQNQFSHAFKEAGNAINIRHSGMLNENLANARDVLTRTHEYIKNYEWQAETYAGMTINDRVLQQVIKECVLRKDIEAEDYKEHDEIRIQTFMDAYNSDDNSNFKGTAWGIVNAITDYTTHLQPMKKITDRFAERRFIHNTFDNKVLDRTINIIERAA